MWLSGLNYWVSKGVLRELTAVEAQSLPVLPSAGAEAAATAGSYIDPFADDAEDTPDRYFTLVEEQQGLATMDVSVDSDAQGNQVGHVDSWCCCLLYCI